MIKFFNFLILFFAFSMQCFGQNNTDVQSRIITSIDYKLNKKWKFGTEFRYNLENDLQKFRSSVFQFETKYTINKSISLLGAYRFTTSYQEDNHRFIGGLEYNYKINKKFSFSSITRFQYSTNSFDPDFMREFKEPVKMTRQKLGIDYNVPKSKFSFKLAAEMFLKTNSEPFFEYNRMRYEIGSNYDFEKFGKFGLSTFYDDKYSPLKDDRIVIEAKYIISLNSIIEKEEKKKKKNKKEKKIENK